MKLLALVAIVVASSCVAAGVAVATASGNGAPTVQFAVEYDAGGPIVTCKGQRIVTTGPNASVRDRETCHVTDQTLWDEGTYPIVPFVDANFETNTAWWSDYEYDVNPGGGTLREAVSGTLVVKNLPNGTQVWQIHATY